MSFAETILTIHSLCPNVYVGDPYGIQVSLQEMWKSLWLRRQSRMG